MNKEVAQASLLRPWEDEDRMGIELLSGQHGGQSIEIRIRMGGNYFHNQFAIFNGQWSISSDKGVQKSPISEEKIIRSLSIDN
jgi:hypothetical protein